MARFVVAFAPTFWTGVELTWIEANGRASVLASQEGASFALVTVSATSQDIDHIMWVMNPAKLARISTAKSA